MIEVEPNDFRELIEAAQRSADRPLLTLERADLPLGELTDAVERVAADLTPNVGRGFAVLRSIPVDLIGKDLAARVFWGIGLHLGEPVSQNMAGEFLCHVRKDPAVAVRGFASDVELGVHSDLTEILGLCALVVAKSGGVSSLVSLAAVHDVLMIERPDLLDVLYEPFYHGRHNEQHPWERPYSIHPVFARGSKGWGGFYNPGMLGRTDQIDGVPPLTARQIEAVDAVRRIAERPDLRLTVALQPGDMLFAHNAFVLHARTSFEDHEDPDRRRHFYRLWLDRPDCESSTVPWPVRFDFRYGNSGLTRRGVPAAQGSQLLHGALPSTNRTD